MFFFFFFFFFNDTATTEIYTLSLHDALPIWPPSPPTERARWRSTAACTARGSTPSAARSGWPRSEEHTSELQSHSDLVCRLLLEKKNGGTGARARRSHELSRRGGQGDERTRRRVRPFFFNDTPTTQIYTLSLHDALPIGALRVA